MLPNHVFLLPLLLSAGAVLAARPSGQTICDYYAKLRFGANNKTTQLRLMQYIVAYAYAGGSTVAKTDENNSTGIFNPGKFNGRDVFLRPYFNGSKATTNLNGQPVGVNWLDGGGTKPLLAFLNNSTATAEITQGTNQYTLFTHWYVAFGKIYGCTLANKFLDKSFTPLTPAYVHKFMDLNQTHIAYFIEQLIAASKFCGFSDADAANLSNFMNARYNNRCSPPVDGQLYSICLADDCPLAAPSADCKPYPQVKPYGVDNAGDPSGTEKPVLPTVSASSRAASTSGTGGSSSSLSAGAIAGISIGAAVVALLAIGMFLFFRRQQKAKVDNGPAVDQTGNRTSHAFPPQSFSPESFGRANPHDSYYSRDTRDSYMTSAPRSPPPAWAPVKVPHELGTHSSETPSAMASPNHHPPEMRQIAEMESPNPPVQRGPQDQAPGPTN